jgi:hypothetical protein
LRSAATARKQRFGFAIARLGMADATETHQGYGGVIVVGPERALSDSQGALQVAFGLGVAGARDSHVGKTGKGSRHFHMIYSKRLLANRQHALQDVLRNVMLALGRVKLAEREQSRRRQRMFLTCHPLRFGDQLAAERCGLGNLPSPGEIRDLPHQTGEVHRLGGAFARCKTCQE